MTGLPPPLPVSRQFAFFGGCWGSKSSCDIESAFSTGSPQGLRSIGARRAVTVNTGVGLMWERIKSRILLAGVRVVIAVLPLLAAVDAFIVTKLRAVHR